MITLQNPIYGYARINGITAKELQIGTGLSYTTCVNILAEPLKKVSPETDTIVTRWASVRIPDMGYPFDYRNITFGAGRPGLTKNVTPAQRKKNFGAICSTCYLAMPLTGVCCDREVISTSTNNV